MTAPHILPTNDLAALPAPVTPWTDYQDALVERLMPELDSVLPSMLALMPLSDALALEDRVMDAVYACVLGQTGPLEELGALYPELAGFIHTATGRSARAVA